MSKSYIANSGIITAIGNDYITNNKSLREGKHGISMPSILDTLHQLPVGEIKKTNDELAQMANERFANYGKRAQKLAHLPRTALLSLLAAQEAWLPFEKKAKGLKIAFISANTVGGMDLTERFYAAHLNNEKDTKVEDIRHHESGAITELVVDALGLKCWNTTISTACSSSVNSIMMATRLIQQGYYDIVLAGGADSLSRFTLNGFNSLMILDKELCKPFDQNRKGLNLGEGAAYFLLANEKAINQFDLKPLAYISGYANANDAHHQTASSPEGKGNRLAMMEALNIAKIDTAQIDYINLHGTGTANNDSSEGMAIQDLFQNKVPLASSTKGFTGHTLGASGSVEAVFSLMSIKDQLIWPNLRFETQIEGLNWSPTNKMISRKIEHILSNSFGFGGNCSALIISKV